MPPTPFRDMEYLPEGHTHRGMIRRPVVGNPEHRRCCVLDILDHPPVRSFIDDCTSGSRFGVRPVDLDTVRAIHHMHEHRYRLYRARRVSVLDLFIDMGLTTPDDARAVLKRLTTLGVVTRIDDDLYRFHRPQDTAIGSSPHLQLDLDDRRRILAELEAALLDACDGSSKSMRVVANIVERVGDMT